ncbi:MAG: hypothetical protein GY775_16915 [Candidatus Scalindua sp.]|nr:hypothetical protein [Candidatus Scalindua sp.]
MKKTPKTKMVKFHDTEFTNAMKTVEKPLSKFELLMRGIGTGLMIVASMLAMSAVILIVSGNADVVIEFIREITK